jgi:hypothetical protein
MFWIYHSWTISDSVFEDNTVLWMVGQSAVSPRYILTFRNCYFDSFTDSLSGGAQVIVDDCEIGAGILPPWGECPNRTPRQSMSVPKSRSQQQSMSSRRSPAASPSPSRALWRTPTDYAGGESDAAVIASITAPVCGVVICAIIVAYLCCRRRRKADEEMELEARIAQSNRDATNLGRRRFGGAPFAPPMLYRETGSPYGSGEQSKPASSAPFPGAEMDRRPP